MKKKIVVLGFLGTNLDLGGKARWGRWRFMKRTSWT